MTLNDRALEEVNESRMARLAWDVFGKYLKNQKDEVIKKLAALQRGGTVEHTQYAAYMGAFVELDNLELKIRRVVEKSEKTEKELLNVGAN